VIKFYFAYSKQTKQPFLAKHFTQKCKISKCKGGPKLPCPPFPTPMDMPMGKNKYFAT